MRYAYTWNEIPYCMHCVIKYLALHFQYDFKALCYYQEELHHFVVGSVISDTEIHATSYY